MVAPCKDCMKRKISCHSSCKQYKDWKCRYKTKDEEESEYRAYLNGAVQRMRRARIWTLK